MILLELVDGSCNNIVADRTLQLLLQVLDLIVQESFQDLEHGFPSDSGCFQFLFYEFDFNLDFGQFFHRIPIFFLPRISFPPFPPSQARKVLFSVLQFALLQILDFLSLPPCLPLQSLFLQGSWVSQLQLAIRSSVSLSLSVSVSWQSVPLCPGCSWQSVPLCPGCKWQSVPLSPGYPPTYLRDGHQGQEHQDKSGKVLHGKMWNSSFCREGCGLTGDI